MRTGGRPFHTKSERHSMPVLPPPAYTDKAPELKPKSSDEVEALLREQIVAEMRRVIPLVKEGTTSDPSTMYLQTLITVNTGIVVSADVKNVPRLHEALMVAKQALLRWDETGQRTRFVERGYGTVLEALEEG